MTRTLLLVLALSAVAVAQEPPKQPQGWEGRFSDGRSVLVLIPDAAGTVGGSFEALGKTFVLKGARQPDGSLAGTLESEGGRSYDFTATLAKDVVSLVAANTTYRLPRRAAPPPPPPLPPGLPAEEQAAPKDDKEAVTRGVAWLVRHQNADGSWSPAGWGVRCPPQARCAGGWNNDGDARYQVGLTGLATIALLRGAPQDPDARRAAEKAVAWLVGKQGLDGSVGFDPGNGASVYNHAWAAQALGVAAVVLADAKAKGAAADAAGFCGELQNPGLGWKYGVRPGRNDTAVTTAMVEALHAARTAECRVPDAWLEGANHWVLRVTDSEGRVGYETPGGGSSFFPQQDGKFDQLPVMTAAGIVVRRRVDAKAEVRKSAAHLREARPVWEQRKLNFYYWYHGTKASTLVGGEDLRLWRVALTKALLPNQRRGACASGSWDAIDEWGLAGGRVYATAINVVSLATTGRD